MDMTRFGRIINKVNYIIIAKEEDREDNHQKDANHRHKRFVN